MSSEDFSVPQAVLIYRQFLTELGGNQMAAAILTAGLVIGKAFSVNDDPSLKQQEKELSFADAPDKFCCPFPQEGRGLIILDIVKEKGVLIVQEHKESNCSVKPVEFEGEDTVRDLISGITDLLAKDLEVDFLYKPKFKKVGWQIAEAYKEDKRVLCKMIP